MEDQDKLDKNRFNFDTIFIKIQRFFKKYESSLSKVLIVISFIIFLIENIIISFLSALNEPPFVVILFLIISGGCVILVPIIFYLWIITQLNPTQTKSYELIGTVIFLIATIVNYFSEFTIFFLSSIGTLIIFYPGNYIIAIIASSCFILMGVVFVPRKLVRITKKSNMEFIKSSLKKRINFLEKKSESLEKKFKENLKSIEVTQNFENPKEILKIYVDNLYNYENLILSKHQLYLLENDPKILRKLSKKRIQAKINKS